MQKGRVTLRVAGGIPYELTRKKVKYFNLHVRRDGSVALSSPLRISPEAADHYIIGQMDWIRAAQAGVLNGQKPAIKVRSMTSCWGVCHMAKRQITFALQLYNMPEAAQIYVVVHEYCHFLQPNHSPAFWAEVAKLMPDWKARRDLLKR